MRKVVQIVYQAPAEYTPGCFTDEAMVALCDDGTIWERTSGGWEQIEGPPGIVWEEVKKDSDEDSAV